MAERVRRRDLAIPGRRKRARTWLVIAVVAVFVLLLLWLALQTLGGQSTKPGAAVPAQLL